MASTEVPMQCRVIEQWLPPPAVGRKERRNKDKKEEKQNPFLFLWFKG